MNEIVQHNGSALAIRGDQSDWTPEQGQALLEMFNLGNAPHSVIRSYFHVCQTTGLDPFKRQIHLIERSGKFTPQTSIDGFRIIRDRSKVFDGGEIHWCGPDGVWRDVWLEKDYPAAARYTLHRTDQKLPAVATALWGAYVQTKRDGSVTQMWDRMGAHMLAKVAEALAIRMAFPDDTGGLYTDDEMAQASSGQGEGSAGAPRRERSPGIMDLETPPVSAPPAQAADPGVGGGFMDVPPAEDPNIEDAVIVTESETAPEQPAAAPPAQEEPVAAPPVAEAPNAPESAVPEAGAPMDMNPVPEPERTHKFIWSEKLAEASGAADFDVYKLRLIYDEAAAAGALAEPVPWGVGTFEQTVMAMRANLDAGAPALQGIA